MNNERQDISKPIPLHRVALVRPFARFLEDIGAPVERGFRQAGLPYSSLEDVNNYIPSHRFWTFLVNMARSEGIEDLGFRVGEQFGASSADPKMTALMLQEPTLYRGLLKASGLVNRTVSHCRIGIRQPPNCGYAYFYHHPSCSADNPAFEHISGYGLTVLIEMVRLYIGPQWQPSEFGLMTNQNRYRYIREYFPLAHMRPSRTCSYIALENELLSLPPSPNEAIMPVSSSYEYESLKKDLASSLEQVLLSYLQEPDLSVELAAGLCNISKRSLQRQLKVMGTHYAELLDNARFRVACRMLQSPGAAVTKIAQRLGYSDLAHFIRFFRRIAGVTPLAYRKHFKH